MEGTTGKEGDCIEGWLGVTHEKAFVISNRMSNYG